MKTTVHVIVFESTHYAIGAEKVFKESNIKHDIIPTPREITHSCGLSIRFLEEDFDLIQMKIVEHNIKIKGIYEIQKMGQDKEIRQIS